VGIAQIVFSTEDTSMLTNIFEITTKQYQALLAQTIKSKGNIMTFGQAGIGKTEIAIQVAKQMGYDIVYWNLSTQQPPDLVGLPVIHGDRVKYSVPYHMPIDMDKKPVVVIVDELDKADSDLQNPMLEVFQFHSINGRPLNIQAIISTGNLPDEGSFSKPVSHALANRCMVFKLTSNFDEWQEWATSEAVEPLIVGFLSRNPEFLSKKVDTEDPTAYCKPSPRSWSSAAKSNVSELDINFASMLIAGYVGQEAAVKFRVWLEFAREIEPNIDALIKDGVMPPTSWGSDKVLIAALQACGYVQRLGLSIMEQTDKKKKADMAVKLESASKNVFSWLAQMPPNFQVCAVKSSVTYNMIEKCGLFRIPEVVQVFKALKESRTMGEEKPSK
jgi:hypothetical protein